MPAINVEKMVTRALLPELKEFDNKLFPLVLTPRPDLTSQLEDIASVINWIVQEKNAIDELLLENGAIVFRGFPVKDPNDFDLFVKAFGGEPLEYIGGAAVRNRVVGDVFTANEAPPDQLIPFHHEMAQVPIFPKRLFFYCDVAPVTGGETPLALSHEVYKRMRDKHPDFVSRVENEGVRYRRVLPDGDDNSSPIGRGWQSTFQTQDKDEAVLKAKAQGTSTEWLPNGCLQTVTASLLGVRTDERTGKKMWFNSIIAAYRGWRDVRNCEEKAVTFPDGSPMPPEVMDDLEAIFEDVSVAVKWQKGDVILVDNIQVLHARRSFTPPRQILASLVK